MSGSRGILPMMLGPVGPLGGGRGVGYLVYFGFHPALMYCLSFIGGQVNGFLGGSTNACPETLDGNGADLVSSGAWAGEAGEPLPSPSESR